MMVTLMVASAGPMGPLMPLTRPPWKEKTEGTKGEVGSYWVVALATYAAALHGNFPTNEGSKNRPGKRLSLLQTR